MTEVLPDFYEDIKFHADSNGCILIKRFKPLEVSLLIDNLVSNSINARARNFTIDVCSQNGNTMIGIADDGNGWSKDLGARNVFEKGVSTTSGSGLGLFNAMQFVKTELGGEISIVDNYDSGCAGNPGVKIQIIL